MIVCTVPRAYLVAQMLKNLPEVQETWIWSLGQEDPLEKGMATHSNIPAWRTPWTEEPGGLESMGSQKVRHNWATELNWTELVAQMVKNLPAMRETQVWSLGWEDLLEKGMAAHSNILAWRIPWTEKLVGYSQWGHKESDMTEQLTVFTLPACGFVHQPRSSPNPAAFM